MYFGLYKVSHINKNQFLLPEVICFNSCDSESPLSSKEKKKSLSYLCLFQIINTFVFYNIMHPRDTKSSQHFILYIHTFTAACRVRVKITGLQVHFSGRLG